MSFEMRGDVGSVAGHDQRTGQTTAPNERRTAGQGDIGDCPLVGTVERHEEHLSFGGRPKSENCERQRSGGKLKGNERSGR